MRCLETEENNIRDESEWDEGKNIMERKTWGNLDERGIKCNEQGGKNRKFFRVKNYLGSFGSYRSTSHEICGKAVKKKKEKKRFEGKEEMCGSAMG